MTPIAFHILALSLLGVATAAPSRLVRDVAPARDLPDVMAIAPELVPLEMAKDRALEEATQADLTLALQERGGDQDAAQAREELAEKVEVLKEVEAEKLAAEEVLSEELSHLAEGVNEANDEFRHVKSAVNKQLHEAEDAAQAKLDDAAQAVDEATLASVANGGAGTAQAIKERDAALAEIESLKEKMMQQSEAKLAAIQDKAPNSEQLKRALEEVQAKLADTFKNKEDIQKAFQKTMSDVTTGAKKVADKVATEAKKHFENAKSIATTTMAKLKKEAEVRIGKATKQLNETKDRILAEAFKVKQQFEKEKLPELTDRIKTAGSAIYGIWSSLMSFKPSQ